MLKCNEGRAHFGCAVFLNGSGNLQRADFHSRSAPRAVEGYSSGSGGRAMEFLWADFIFQSGIEPYCSKVFIKLKVVVPDVCQRCRSSSIRNIWARSVLD